MENSVNIISSIIGLLLGGGGMGILFYREKKKALSINNEKSISDVWQKIFDEVQEQNSILQTKLDKKDEKIDSLYVDLLKIKSENNTLTTQVGVLTWQKCLVNTCVDRTPPRDK